jgi:hypothetical protein
MVVFLRFGARRRPWGLRMLPTVWSLMVYPRLARAPERLTLLGAIELLCDELAVPGKARVRFDEMCDLFQSLLSELFAHLG